MDRRLKEIGRAEARREPWAKVSALGMNPIDYYRRGKAWERIKKHFKLGERASTIMWMHGHLVARSKQQERLNSRHFWLIPGDDPRGTVEFATLPDQTHLIEVY